MAGVTLRIPTVNQIVMLAITVMCLFALVRILPLPQQFKNLFRV